jgi:hypothetical protein
MRRRPFLLLATAALALIATVQPAVAYTELGGGGKTYDPNIYEEMSPSAAGAVCKYTDKSDPFADDPLKSLTVRKFYTHGPFASKAYVGYRVTILRNGVPYYTTPMIKRKASLTEVASFGPTTWSKPAGRKGNFQAVIKLTFYNPNGVKKGSSRGIIDVYAYKLGTAPIGFTEGDPGDPYNFNDANDPGHCQHFYPTIF